jgi:hypothetical protein
MSNNANVAQPPFQRPSPPSKHQLALMIWLSVLPTLTVTNLALGDWLVTLPPCSGPWCSPPSRSRSSSTA